MKHIITPEEISTYARACSTDRSILERVIDETETEDIRPRLGDSLYLAVTADTTDDRFTTLLEGGSWNDRMCRDRRVEGLKKAVAYFAYARVIRDANLQATRYGTVVKTDNNSTSPTKEDRERQYNNFFALADRYLKDCLVYLVENNDLFPEYRGFGSIVNNRSRMRVVGDRSSCRSTDKSNYVVIQGEKGDPLTWDDLTLEQKQALVAPYMIQFSKYLGIKDWSGDYNVDFGTDPIFVQLAEINKRIDILADDMRRQQREIDEIKEHIGL